MSALPNDVERARELYQSLRWQLAPSAPMTMVRCSNEGCEQWSRGSRECTHCITEHLERYIGKRATILWLALTASRNAIEDAEEAIAELENGR